MVILSESDLIKWALKRNWATPKWRSLKHEKNAPAQFEEVSCCVVDRVVWSGMVGVF